MLTKCTFFVIGNESETKLVVSLVVIGLLLGTLFIIDLVLMCSKKGLMYSLAMKCSEKNGNQEFISKSSFITYSPIFCVSQLDSWSTRHWLIPCAAG